MTTRKTLRISKDLALPTDFATKSAAILAQRRKGKSYTAAVLAEECVACEIPFVILDPTGAHWGLRASADGKREGLPVYVFGGEHPSDPDLKLERTAGKLIADFVVDFPGYYVVDFKSFESKEAERQFATDFAERLYRYKGQPGKDFVMHLFVDEADLFCPQRIPSGDQRMLGAFESIVRRGGIRGLGTSLISQRAAVVNKNVLEQIDILIALRTVGPNDREAIRKYVVANGTEDEVRELMGSIASLELGEAWVYEPGAEPALFERVRIRERNTFNSSATPKAGEKRVEPKKLADVELAALRERMAATIEKTKAEDPKELNKRIRELEKNNIDLARRLNVAEGLTKTETVEVEVPTVPEGLEDKLLELTKAADRIGNDLSLVHDELSAAYGVVKKIAEASAHGNLPDAGVRERSNGARRRPTPRTDRRDDDHRGARPGARIPVVQRVSTPDHVPVRTHRLHDDGAGPAGGELRLGPGEKATLIAVAQYDDGCSREQLTILTGYKRSSRNTYIQRLRAAGLITDGDRVRATDAGVAFLGDYYEPLPVGAELRSFWLNKLRGGEREILAALIDAYPEGVDREALSEQTGYTRSSRNTYIQRLRARELVDDRGSTVYASGVLFEGDA